MVVQGIFLLLSVWVKMDLQRTQSIFKAAWFFIRKKAADTVSSYSLYRRTGRESLLSGLKLCILHAEGLHLRI